MSLPTRILGRTERAVPPVLWELSLTSFDSGTAQSALETCASAGAHWFLIPAAVPTGDLPLLVQSLRSLPTAHVVLGVNAADLVARTRRAEVERVDSLSPLRCAAILVESAGPSEMKSGGPFHRVNNLRNAGRCDFVFADADTVADAEWMIAQTPAHAVTVPFGVADQTAAYRVFATAGEVGTAILARRPERATWHVEAVGREMDASFALAHPAVTMVVERFPRDRDDASDILSAIARPISDAEREAWWKRFSAEVKEPPKPRGNHPPEYGA